MSEHEPMSYTDEVPERATVHGAFEVTIHGALRESFNRWLEAEQLGLTYFGDNEAGTPTFVQVLRQGSARERLFFDMRGGDPDA